MKSHILKYANLIQKILIVVFVCWGAFMLVKFWQSGEEETELALATGKRFVIDVQTGAVTGQPPRIPGVTVEVAEAEEEEKYEEELVVPTSEDVQAIIEEIPPIKESANPIAAVDDALTEKEKGLVLPKIAADGRKPWQYYAKKFKRVDERPLVSVIVTGLGLSQDNTQKAFALNENISLSFSPYARAVAGWIDASRRTGHEAFIDVPVQTAGYPMDDPGPYSILLSNSNTLNISHLKWALSRVQGFAGIVTPTDGVISSNTDTSKPLIDELTRRGLLMVLGREPIQRGTRDLINQSAMPNLVVDVWLDEELSEMGMQARLATLEQIAHRKGYAIGLARAYPLSLKQLEIWEKRLDERGIVIAPVTFLTLIGK